MQLDQVRGADNIVGLSSIYEIIVHKILYDFTVRKGSGPHQTQQLYVIGAGCSVNFWIYTTPMVPLETRSLGLP